MPVTLRCECATASANRARSRAVTTSALARWSSGPACRHPVQQIGEPVPVEAVEGGLLRTGLPHRRGDDGVLELVR